MHVAAGSVMFYMWKHAHRYLFLSLSAQFAACGEGSNCKKTFWQERGHNTSVLQHMELLMKFCVEKALGVLWGVSPTTSNN